MTTAANITVRVPLATRRRPERKTIVLPEGAASPAPARSCADPALAKALARAHRWQRLLEEGRYASISELAAAEKIERGYLGRVLRLTLLAPDIVQAIFDGRQPAELALPALLQPFPADWERQRNCGFLVSRSDDPAAPRPPAAVRSAPMRLGTTPVPGLPAEERV